MLITLRFAGVRGASAASEVAATAASEVAAAVSSSPQHAHQAIATGINIGVKHVQLMGDSLSAPFTATRELVDGDEPKADGDRRTPRYLNHEQLPLSEIKSRATKTWLDWQVWGARPDIFVSETHFRPSSVLRHARAAAYAGRGDAVRSNERVRKG